MKKKIIMGLFCLITNSWSASLIEVFQDALENDPIYQKELIKTQLSFNDINISAAALLPNLGLITQPLTDNQTSAGSITSTGLQPQNNVYHSMDTRITLTQPVFNIANFLRFSAAKSSYQAAGAHLNAEYQALMLRVAQTYFNTLYYENKLLYYKSHRKAAALQLHQVKAKYHVGKLNGSELDTAQSALSVAESNYIDTQIQLLEYQQKLSQMTNADYPQLNLLKDDFPLLVPQPANMEKWVDIALKQNWNVKTHQLLVKSAKEQVRQQSANYLPNLNAELDYDNQHFHAKNGSLLIAPGSSSQKNIAAFLTLNVPIYSGGLMTANVKKYQHLLQIEQLKLDYSVRTTHFAAKQSFMKIQANLQKIKSDKQIIKSSTKLLQAYKEKYKMGVGSLIDIINQQDNLTHAQINYNKDKYNYIIEVLRLKKVAGTLSLDDLYSVNSWLKNECSPTK